MINEEYDIRLAGVREIGALTHINRWELMRHDGSEVNITLHASYERRNATRLALLLEADYTSPRALVRRHLLHYAMEMLFEIDSLEEMTDDSLGELLLPRSLMLSTMNAGVGTLRGMIAAQTASTFLANYPLPLMNISALVSNMEEAPAMARGRLPEITVTN